MVNSDTHQEEYHGSQDIDPEKHTLDYRFCRCRRTTLRLLPLSISHWGGRSSTSFLWTRFWVLMDPSINTYGEFSNHSA